MRGINVTSLVDILLLAYADDLVILAESPVDVQRKLKVLKEYCEENDLVVNVKKTKILICQRGNKIKKLSAFKYGDEVIEVVKNYVYLGVKFTRNGLFSQQTNDIIARANISIGSVKQVLLKSKNDSFESIMKLWQTVTSVSILYASETWALRYCDNLESAQCKYFKDILRLQKCTPHYIVRAEAGLEKLEIRVIALALTWLFKIETMPYSRFPKLCLDKLREMDKRKSNLAKYNWITQVRQSLDKVKGGNLLDKDLSQPESKEYAANILSQLREKFLNNDQIHCSNSTFVPIYCQLNSENNFERKEYLFQKISFTKKRLFCQLRTNNVNCLLINVIQMSYKINPNEICSICNMLVPENLEHIIFNCPMYKEIRQFHLTHLPENVNLLLDHNIDSKIISKLFNFITSAMKIRSFIINE